jgi:Tfp pilus assembly ATPase PilU
MQTMNQALFLLYQRRQISLEVAYEHASDAEELRMMMEGRFTTPRPPTTRY